MCDCATLPLAAIQTGIGPNFGVEVVDKAWCSRMSDGGGCIAGERRTQTGYFLDFFPDWRPGLILVRVLFLPLAQALAYPLAVDLVFVLRTASCPPGPLPSIQTRLRATVAGRPVHLA